MAWDVFNDVLRGGEPVLIIGACACALSYLAATAVALFHPSPRRRADARAVLERHRLSRAKSRPRHGPACSDCGARATVLGAVAARSVERAQTSGREPTRAGRAAEG